VRLFPFRGASISNRRAQLFSHAVKIADAFVEQGSIPARN
jgi:hypothetical protein